MSHRKGENKIESSIRYGRNVSDNMRRFGIEHDVGGADTTPRIEDSADEVRVRNLRLVVR
jgi:hypothetical protein